MITLENVNKIYSNGLHAVKDVNLKVNEGDIFGIIGLSGAGKSSLIRLINRLEEPTSGKIFINGEDILSLNKTQLLERRKKIGMIFQHFNLLSSRTVEENVAFALEIANWNKKDIGNRVSELLEIVGLSDKAKYYPSQLSGGQKQRVSIARALANNPDILLSDEATSALDPKTTKSILELIKEIQQKFSLTVLMITHQMEVVKEICNKVAIMSDGKIVEQGGVHHIFADPKNEITKEFQTEIVKKVGTVDTSMAESYFNSTIIPAYKNMNSKKDSEGNYYLSEEDFQDLTNYQEGKGNFKLSDKEIKALTKKNDKNETEDVKGQNLVDEWSDKFTYAFTSIFDVVVVGIVYLSMGLGRVVILLSYALLLLISPFALILSLFLQFSHYFGGISKKGISFLLISSAISLASVIVPIIYGNMSSYIEDFGGGPGLVATFLKCIVIWWLFKNRDNLLSFMNGKGNPLSSLTRGRLGRLGNGMNLQRAKTFATKVGDRVPNRVKSLARITKNNAQRWVGDKAKPLKNWNENRLEKRSSLAKMEIPQNDDYVARKIKRAKKVEWRKAHRREMLDRAKMKVEYFKNYGEKDENKRSINNENYDTLQNRVRENMYRKQEIKGHTPKARTFENGVWKATDDLPSLKRLERKERIRRLQKKKGRLGLQERLAT